MLAFLCVNHAAYCVYYTMPGSADMPGYLVAKRGIIRSSSPYVNEESQLSLKFERSGLCSRVAPVHTTVGSEGVGTVRVSVLLSP